MVLWKVALIAGLRSDSFERIFVKLGKTIDAT